MYQYGEILQSYFDEPRLLWCRCRSLLARPLFPGPFLVLDMTFENQINTPCHALLDMAVHQFSNQLLFPLTLKTYYRLHTDNTQPFWQPV
jgi:hypothetical protein